MLVGFIYDAIVEEPLPGIGAGVDHGPFELHLDPIEAKLFFDRAHRLGRVPDDCVGLGAVAELIGRPGRYGAAGDNLLRFRHFFGRRPLGVCFADDDSGKRRGGRGRRSIGCS